MESILVTLFCCLPFGIAGIIYASKVESKFYAGDHQGALLASEDAGRWTKIGFWVGIVAALIWVVFVIVTALNGGNFENFTPNF